MPAKKKKQARKQRPETTLRPRRVKIKVIGIGGGGCAIVSEMAKSLKKATFLAADTDQRSFRKTARLRTFHFGKDLTRGLGTGMNPDLGREAASKVKEKIEKIFKEEDFVILLSSLGGGVGSGATPFFAQVAGSQRNITLGIFTLPFSFEGDKKMKIAKNSLKTLRENLSGSIVLSNEEIFKICDKRTPLKKALSLMNQILIEYLEDLIEMLSNPGVINIDFADLRTILQGRGRVVYFAQSEAQGPNRVEEATKGLFNNPLFVRPDKIKRILFNVSGGKDLALKEVDEVARMIATLNPKAKIIFGISQNAKYSKRIKITLLGVGESLIEEREEKTIEKTKEKRNNRKEADINNKRKKQKEKAGEIKVRRSGVEIKKDEEMAEKEEREKETEWELPAFLRSKNAE